MKAKQAVKIEIETPGWDVVDEDALRKIFPVEEISEVLSRRGFVCKFVGGIYRADGSRRKNMLIDVHVPSGKGRGIIAHASFSSKS
jgi:hypothetical protein